MNVAFVVPFCVTVIVPEPIVGLFDKSLYDPLVATPASFDLIYVHKADIGRLW